MVGCAGVSERYVDKARVRMDRWGCLLLVEEPDVSSGRCGASSFDVEFR